MTKNCPCGTGKIFADCCQPFIEGKLVAPTAEALMRSRYTAYVLADINYLLNSHHPSTRPSKDRKKILKWAKSMQWKGLEVLACMHGKEDDTKGWVEFKASYLEEGEPQEIHENSVFVKENGKWYYQDGEHF